MQRSLAPPPFAMVGRSTEPRPRPMQRPHLPRHAPRALLLTAALLSSAPAHALTCDEVAELLGSGIDASVVVATLEAEGTPVTGGGAACLETRRAPDEVIVAARDLETKVFEREARAPVFTPSPSLDEARSTPVQAVDRKAGDEAAAPVVAAPAAPPVVAAPAAAPVVAAPAAPPLVAAPAAPANQPAARTSRTRLFIGLGVSAGGLALLGASSALRGGIRGDLESGGASAADVDGRVGQHNVLVGSGYALLVGGAATAGSTLLSTPPLSLRWSTQW